MPRLSVETKVTRAIRAFEKTVRKILKDGSPCSCYQCKECGQVYVELNQYQADKCWACGASEWASLWKSRGAVKGTPPPPPPPTGMFSL